MAATGGLFTLDLSEMVGWAYGHRGDARPLCGVWQLAGPDLGRCIASFENELEDALVLHQPALILAEAPLSPALVRSNIFAWRQQLSLAGAAEAAAYRHGVRYREQSASTIRSEVLGTCRFPKGEVKHAVLAYCAQRGWRVPDHNAGDACVVWEYGCRHMPAPRHAPVAA